MAGTPPLGPRWADLVFHVLAHVRPAGPFASSLFDETYIAFSEKHAGPAAARSLGADADVLGRAVTSHEALARLQWVARLFDDTASARAVAQRDLSGLRDGDVADAVALRALSDVSNAAEVLRAAAELEAPHHAKLPVIEVEPALAAALERASPAAPRLAGFRVECLRALRVRGRLFDSRIWVGVPSAELSLTAEHVAVQAAHEATVAEVAGTARSHAVELGERSIEHIALVLFAERAARGPLAEAHSRWWAQLSTASPSAIGDHLDERQRSVLAACDHPV
jgi:hypothetical protein